MTKHMESKKTALFAGSFDPITKGHENILLRAMPLFDEIIIGIGLNSEKKSFFSLEQRKRWIETAFANYPKVKVATYDGLTIDFCRKTNVRFLIRGIRNHEDFMYEQNLALINKDLAPEIETVFFSTLPEFSTVSSSLVRELLAFGKDVSKYLPEAIGTDFEKTTKTQQYDTKS